MSGLKPEDMRRFGRPDCRADNWQGCNNGNATFFVDMREAFTEQSYIYPVKTHRSAFYANFWIVMHISGKGWIGFMTGLLFLNNRFPIPHVTVSFNSLLQGDFYMGYEYTFLFILSE